MKVAMVPRVSIPLRNSTAPKMLIRVKDRLLMKLMQGPVTLP